MKVQITGLHEKDAYSEVKELVVGLIGEFVTIPELRDVFPGYRAGLFVCDIVPPIEGHDNRDPILFAGVQFLEVV